MARKTRADDKVLTGEERLILALKFWFEHGGNDGKLDEKQVAKKFMVHPQSLKQALLMKRDEQTGVE